MFVFWENLIFHRFSVSYFEIYWPLAGCYGTGQSNPWFWRFGKESNVFVMLSIGKGHLFCKYCLHNLQIKKTRYSSPNLSKLARADISCQGTCAATVYKTNRHYNFFLFPKSFEGVLCNCISFFVQKITVNLLDECNSFQ